jgi:hypothetical protein
MLEDGICWGYTPKSVSAVSGALDVGPADWNTTLKLKSVVTPLSEVAVVQDSVGGKTREGGHKQDGVGSGRFIKSRPDCDAQAG